MMQTLVSAYDVYWPVTTKNVSKFVLELFHYWVNGVISNIFLHTMPGYCYLNPGWDISILHPPHPPIALAPMYPTLTNHLFMTTTTTTKVQLNKLPQTTIIFRIIRTVQYVLITPKYKHMHLVQYVSVVTTSNHTVTFCFRCLTYTIFRTYVYSIVSL